MGPRVWFGVCWRSGLGSCDTRQAQKLNNSDDSCLFSHIILLFSIILYCVLYRKILMEMASQRPRDFGQTRSVSGLGPASESLSLHSSAWQQSPLGSSLYPPYRLRKNCVPTISKALAGRLEPRTPLRAWTAIQRRWQVRLARGQGAFRVYEAGASGHPDRILVKSFEGCILRPFVRWARHHDGPF